MSSMNLSQREGSMPSLSHLYDRNTSMLAMNIFANIGAQLVPKATSDVCLKGLPINFKIFMTQDCLTQVESYMFWDVAG